MYNEINSIEEDFNAALSRYKAGQDLITIVQDFQKIIQQIPNHFAAWTCLSWLQLLLKNNEEALAAARQAVRLNQQDPQARMNLSLALLATNNKGVRNHIELIKKMSLLMPDVKNELKESVQDGFSRYPDWPELIKVKNGWNFKLSRILILSNGHGEDLSGSLIAKQLKKNGYSVNALPIVGKGIHYEKEKIKIIGKTKEFSTGGIGYNSLKGRLAEIFGGEIIYLLRRLYITYKIRNKYDYFIVVGDIVPVFFAWVCKKDFFTYLVAYSSHYEGKLKLPWPSKFFLLSQKAKKIYTRDCLTASDLTLQLKKNVSFLGNPFMDKFFYKDKELEKSEFSIGLFAGSRFPEILDNFVLILEVLEALSDLRYFQKIEFNFAIVNAISSSKIKEILQNRKWLYLKKIKEKYLLKFQYKSLEVNVYWNNFDKVLLKSRCCISMAGTAAEQAIGLGKPVIQIEGKGPQFTKSFAEAQRRLLGKYVFCASNYRDKNDQINQTIKLIIKVIYLIKLNKKFLILCNENAKERLGENKACIKMVDDMNIVMRND